MEETNRLLYQKVSNLEANIIHLLKHIERLEEKLNLRQKDTYVCAYCNEKRTLLDYINPDNNTIMCFCRYCCFLRSF